MQLLDDRSLERSAVVANSKMNRERRAFGINSYERELGLNPLEFLASRVASHGSASWLDACCGRGRALLQAAEFFSTLGSSRSVSLRGIDLLPAFEPASANFDYLKLEAAALHRWDTSDSFDLITCVHGLHYVGDKVRAIERATTWLASDGRLAANLDLANIVDVNGGPLARQVMKRFRQCGFLFNHRRHVLSRSGKADVTLGLEFVGADDSAGPNYTRQDAVSSIYRVARPAAVRFRDG